MKSTLVATIVVLLAALPAHSQITAAPVFVCAEYNDLYKAVMAAGGRSPRHASAVEAVAAAPTGGAVLVLADGYPDTRVQVADEVFEAAAKKQLTMYLEYPARVPGLELGAVRTTEWERAVVASESFGSALPRLHILAIHDCHYLPVAAADPMLVIGRVAGFDTAVFGLPAKADPILFKLPERRLIIATTCLSKFVTGRYAPTADWAVLWTELLKEMGGGQGSARPVLRYSPVVRPRYGRDEPLPASAEEQALRAAADWLVRSQLLVHADEESAVHALLRKNTESRPLPPADAPVGDGSCGILEGYASGIGHDGSQQQRNVLRSDCIAESAMCLAFDAALNKTARSRKIAENLLDYLYFRSELHGGVRGDPRHPAFGHVAWGAVSPLWTRANYGDDDARVILSTILASACLGSDRWDERIVRALLANLRTTGRKGFRGDRIDIPDLEANGWKHYHDREIVSPSPHFESALWACYLWAYARTQHRPFLDSAKSGIRLTMDAYPDGWRWRSNLERARMILCLAWLVRAEDTPEHRDWLRRVADDLIAAQERCGAIRENLGTTGSGHFMAPTSNEEYGTRETPLVQREGDPASDQLYTTGFALFGLREVNAATGESRLKAAEDRLAAYLCRIQIRSESLPFVDGWWFRAFDYGRWDYWASSADAGWGAWCLEAGWGQAWTVAALGLRLKGTSTWELTRDSGIARHMEPVQKLMSLNAGGPWRPTTRPE